MQVDVEGEGTPLLLIHGSAADKTTWSIQRAGLRSRLRLLIYDRRTGGEPSVQDHAADAAAILREHAPDGAFVCGSSFGGVVALHLLRSSPSLVRGALILEPPLSSTPEAQLFADEFLKRFVQLREAQGGSAAAEYFLRTVLGDATYERIPRPYQERSKSLHEEIWEDCRALGEYRVDYDSLSNVKTKVLLIAGERSAAIYRPTLERLLRSLGNARLEILANAGHMMHAEAHRKFNALVLEFVGQSAS